MDHSQVTPESMTFVVSGRAKFTQAQGILGKELFQAYDCDTSAKFGINLTTLLECLQILGPGTLSQTSVSMAYQEASVVRAIAVHMSGRVDCHQALAVWSPV